MSIVKVENLNLGYGNDLVVKDVSFVVEKGDYIGVVGPNGAGKSTLIKGLLNLLPINSGNVSFFGEPLKNFKDWGRIGYLPQKSSLFNPLFPATVMEVVQTGLLSQKKFPKKITSFDREKVFSAMKHLGIENLKDQMISRLSGGQQQRVFLARAMVSNPEILFLDEPSTALDQETREGFFETISHLNKIHGLTIILITHDSVHVGHYANKLLYIDHKLVYYGLFKDFCLSKEMEKEFGGYSQHIICHQHHKK